MTDSTLASLVIPDEQAARQAVASLGGYVHQIVRTVGEWIRLPEGATLLIEAAEDYATLAGAALTMTQVKAVSGPALTLRSDGARKVIASLLQFQDTNPALDVRLIYLTTAEIGHEDHADLPDQSSGIAYWRAVARGADIEPLRTLLLATQKHPAVLAAIAHASPEDLRRRLIDPLLWVAGADPTDAAIKGLEVKLSTLAARKGFAEDGARALPFLIWRALTTAISTERMLTREDFEAEWSRATTISVSFGFVRRAMAALAPDEAGAVGTAPPSSLVLSSRLARRAPLIKGLAASLAQSGVLWLHGSSGLGKSQVARLLVSSSNRHWHFVSLKDCGDSEARARIRGAISGAVADDFGGIVFDDVPVPANEDLRGWIAAAAGEVATAGGSIIVTADREPLPQIRAAFEPLALTVSAAPYLLQEDVADIVTVGGGDPDRWALPIYLTCGAGHPLLVDARVAGLATRGWPSDDLQVGLGLGEGPEELADVRKETVLRLLKELSPDAHLLLLRLSVVVGPFDRLMAFAAASAGSPIARAGALLDHLVGPWIETVAVNRYKLSPLLAQSGATGLDEFEKATVHEAIVDNLIGRNPYPADLLSSLLIHAMFLRRLDGLMTVAAANLSAKNREAIAVHCLPLLFLRAPDGIRLVPENPGISSTLRTAQLVVAVSAPGFSNVEQIFDAALKEADALPPELSSANRYVMTNTVLGARTLDARPRFWVPILIDYREMMRNGGVPAEMTEGLTNTDLGGLSVEQLFFFVRVRKVDSIQDLEELFECLDDLDPEWRHDLLSAETVLVGGPPLFVQMAWSSEARAKQLDAAAAVERFARLADIAAGWGEADVAVECLRSQAVMLDEYLGQSEAALAVLDAADLRFPSNDRLVRSRATVLGTMGRHQDELVLLSTLTDGYSLDEPLERFMTVRAAAISAAKAGDHIKAASLFLLAHEATGEKTSTLHAGVSGGLLGDAAVMQMLANDPASSVRSFRRALSALDQLDLERDPRIAFANAAVVQAMQWALARVESADMPVDMASEPGVCSSLQPTMPEKHAQGSPRTFGWYVLAKLEALLDVNAGVAGALEELEKHRGISVIVAAGVCTAQLDQAIRRLDAERFFSLLPRYVTLISTMAQESAAGKMKAGLRPLDLIGTADWREGETVMARSAVSALIGTLLIDHLPSRALEVARRAAALSPGLGHIHYRTVSLLPGPDFVSAGIGSLRWLLATPEPGPEQLLVTSARIFMWVAHTGLRSPIAPAWGLLRAHWLNLARHRRAILAMPRLAVPAIESMADAPPSLAAIARLIEAGTLAASLPLPDHVRRALRKASAGPGDVP